MYANNCGVTAMKEYRGKHRVLYSNRNNLEISLPYYISKQNSYSTSLRFFLSQLIRKSTKQNELVIMGSMSNATKRKRDDEIMRFYFETTRILEIQNTSFRAIIGGSSN